MMSANSLCDFICILSDPVDYVQSDEVVPYLIFLYCCAHCLCYYA